MSRKFSKNGKPLGRTPVKGDQNKFKAWTPEEDNFLRLAVKEQIPRSVVAVRLGRTQNAVTFRKHVLKIEGPFGRSKRSHVEKSREIQKSVLDHSPSDQGQTQGIQIFKLETGIPVPARAGRNEEERSKIRLLLGSMEIGQSFVVPKNLAHVVKHVIIKEFVSYKTRICATSNEKRFYRVFRVA